MNEIIYVEPPERLLSIDYMDALADALCRLGLSRRKVMDWLADMIFGWLEAGGRIVDHNGVDLEFYPGSIDEVHGKDESVRVISDIMAHSVTARQRRPRVTTLNRLIVYDAAFKAFGSAVLLDTRRSERRKMRVLLRSFKGVWRVRYLREVKRLRRAHRGDRRVNYGLAVHLLRLRFAAEQAAWNERQAA